MKKLLIALSLVGMSVGFAACSDDDSNDRKINSIEDCYPGIYKHANALATQMGDAAGDTDLDKCIARADILTTYLDENSESLKAAGKEYEQYASKDAWNSVSDVACNLWAGMLLPNTWAELKKVNAHIESCTSVITTAGKDDATSKWNAALSGLSSVEGWEAAMNAAIAADQNKDNGAK